MQPSVELEVKTRSDNLLFKTSNPELPSWRTPGGDSTTLLFGQQPGLPLNLHPVSPVLPRAICGFCGSTHYSDLMEVKTTSTLDEKSQ
jgi:hypothetical protein